MYNALGGITFDQVMSLYNNSGFLYGEKSALLKPYWDEIRYTWEKLLKANGGDLFQFHYKEKDGSPSSSICRVYCHDRTWLIQHATSLKDSSGLLENMVKATDWGVKSPICDYVRILYRPNNPWPQRVFGTLTSQLREDSWECHTYDYYYGYFDHADPLVERTGLSIEYLRQSEFSDFESLLSSHHSNLFIAAKCLRAKEIGMIETSRKYAEKGLYRERSILVARQNGQIVGYSLLDFSSIGINLSLLLNAFSTKMFVTDPVAEQNLITSSVGHYLNQGRNFVVALCEDADQSIFSSLGLNTTKQYTELTFAFEENVSALIQHLMDYYNGQHHGS